jgi:Flp pilus assembly protein TadD
MGGSTPAALLVLGSLCLALGAASPVAAADAPSPAREIEQLYRSGNPQQALQRLDRALLARPGDASLRFLRGVLLSEQGRQGEAAAIFERMTEEFPELPEPYNNLAVLQAAAGQFDRARTLLETALRLDPAYATAHENLGDVFIRLAQREYEAAAGQRTEASLTTKLRLVRELAAQR